MIRPGRLGLVALLLIAALGAGAGWLESQISRPYWRRTNSEQVFVDIPRGTSRLGIADILARNGVIRNRLAFFLLSEWHHRRHLQAGEYLFDQPIDSREVFWKISHGQIFVRTITVPEGWTMFDIAAEMDRQGICSRESFLEAAHDMSLISDIAPRAQTLEGFLFPSTYEFTRHTTCDQVVKKMTQDFRSEWAKLNPSGAQQLPGGLTPVEVVSMASLVERETPNPDERPLVAGVFYNRLRDCVIRYSAIRPCSTLWKWPESREGTCAPQICASIPPTTHTNTKACRPGRSAILARLRCEPRSSLRRRTISTSSRTIRADTFSAARSPNTIAMSRVCAICLRVTQLLRIRRQ